MTGTDPIPSHPEQTAEQPERQGIIERARAEALAVIGPALAGIERIEIRLGVPTIGNKEIRSDADLPPGVVLASSSTVEQMRDAERVITEREAERFYADMAEHGIGRESDVTLAEAGLPSDALNEVEGGLLTTKMRALKQMVMEQRPAPQAEDADHQASQGRLGDIVQLASPFRKLNEAKDEFTTAASLVEENREVVARGAALFSALGVDPEHPQTEWDAAVVLWLSDPEFVPAESVRLVGSVNAAGEARAGEEVSGNLYEVGTIRGRRIFLQQVQRMLQIDPASGQPMLRPGSDRPMYTQPNSSQFAAAHAEMLGEESVAVATGATYLPETIAEITETRFDRTLAGKPPVRILPIAYGTTRLATVQGKQTPQRPSLAHAFGGINKAARVYRRIYDKIMDNGLEQLASA